MHSLIDTSGLAARLGTPGLLIIDCRFDLLRPDWGAAEYRAGHVPGALFADVNRDLSGPVTAVTGRHPLPSPEGFAATLGSWGFTPDSEVVCYDQGGGAFAARLWWLLRARGHQRVHLLDGGYAAWLASGGPASAATPTPRPSQVAPRDFPGVVETAQVVTGLASGTMRLVDARTGDRFAGQNEIIDPVAGHIPGAVNHPFPTNLDADGRFLIPARLRAAWEPTLRGAAPESVVMMCGSGVTACHNLLALAVAGIEGPRLYAGSYSEWIRDPARPVTTEAGPTP